MGICWGVRRQDHRFRVLKKRVFPAHRYPERNEMRQKSTTPISPSERLVKNIRRATRKHYSAEEKIRVVLDDLRGEQPAQLIRAR